MLYYYTYKLPLTPSTKLTYWRVKSADEALGLALSLYRTIEFHIDDTTAKAYREAPEGQRGN